MPLLFAHTVSADVLWDNGGFQEGGFNLASARNSTLEAWTVDDFIVQHSVRVTSLQWQLMMRPESEITGGDLILLSAGFEEILTLTDQTIILEFEGEIRHGFERYTATIPDLGIKLAPGRYYIGGRTVSEDDWSYSLLRQPIRGETEAFFRSKEIGYPDWTPGSNIISGQADLAFTLFGEVTHEQVPPDDFNVIFGQHVSGDVESLHESDDEYIAIGNRPAVSAALPVIRMTIEGETIIDEASQIVVTVETAADSRPGLPLQRILVFDFIAQQWVTIDERPATLADSVIEVILEDDPMRFVEPGTGRMKLRLDWFDPGPVINIGWGVRIDQVAWDVTR